MEQAREMKALLALSLLLLCTAPTVTGQEKGAPFQDPCTNGLEVANIFHEERGCSPTQTYYRHNFNRHCRFNSQNSTVSFCRDFFTGYCSTAFPAVKQCFMGNIQNCSADQQHSLTTLAEETGFICQPNTTQVHPIMLYVLDQMSAFPQGDLVNCSRGKQFRLVCRIEAFSSIGILRTDIKDVNMTLLKTFDIQDFVPLIQRAWDYWFECLVRKQREKDMRCQAWRLQAFIVAEEWFIPVILGITNTFTRSQLAELFEFPQP